MAALLGHGSGGRPPKLWSCGAASSVGRAASPTLAAGAWSTGQLRAVMTDSGPTTCTSAEPGPLRSCSTPAYRRLLSDGALGRFDDPLVSSARSAAMLISLDNAPSGPTAGAPNENYGRELLELQTVGLTGSRRPVGVGSRRTPAGPRTTSGAVAHVLSGWSLERGTRRFAFRPAWHDLGPPPALTSWVGPPAGSGEQDLARDLLRHLAQHPATSRHITWKLARRFVADDVAPTTRSSTSWPASTARATPTSARCSAGSAHRSAPGDRSLPTGSGAKPSYDRSTWSPAMLGSTIAVPDPATWQAAPGRSGGSLQSLGQVPMGWLAPTVFPGRSPERGPAPSGHRPLEPLASAAAGGFDALSRSGGRPARRRRA